MACGTLMVEHKFIHGGRSVGHIEDIVVDSSTRGSGLGKLMISRRRNPNPNPQIQPSDPGPHPDPGPDPDLLS